jgi:hypothetical protein
MSTSRNTALGMMVVALLSLPNDPARADAALIATMADGAPWTTAGPNGRSMTITFFPDGTVRMRMGILSRSMTWQASEDGICMAGAPGGDRCIRLEQTESGFVGYQPDGTTMVFER